MAKAHIGSGKVTLFRQEAPGGITYRIPALLYLPSESAFLAFAEERSSPRDEDAKFLVMRRGQKEGTSVQWGPQETLRTAAIPKYRTMNPCPVYEEKSGTVFLFFICVRDHVSAEHQLITGRNAVRFCYVVSRDGGWTWSQATDVTKQAMGGDSRNRATCALGPGHGIQLSSGRLVIPAYACYIHKRCFGLPLFCWTKPHCFTLYSDDGGQSWARGQLLKELSTSECQVAELTCPDDSRVLYLNARTSGHGQGRGEAFSMDGGHQFEEAFLCQDLCEPPKGCQGSVVSFSPLPETLSLDQKETARESPQHLGFHDPISPSAKSWLIFSHPTSRLKRVDLGVYLNTCVVGKGRWTGPWVLNYGPSGYSDLAVCQEGKSLLFACLFECGASEPCEEIAFRLFTDVELLRNVGPSGSCRT